MQVDSPVASVLKSKNIPHRVFTHAGPVTSFEQAAEERGQEPGQIVRSIVFRVKEGEYAMVLVAGKQQISWPVLRKLLGQKRISMASEDEVFEVTGYRRGAVSPFGEKLANMPMFIDESVQMHEEVSLGSGVKGTTIILASKDLVAALPQAQHVDVRKRTDE